MTNTNDDILFGTETTRARDTDGDGVSDAQEGIDGTDPNDAESNIRHDAPELDPFGDTDPRVGLDGIKLERETIVDVAGSTPEGHSLEQTLGTGLDGKPIGKSTNHYGNADAEGLLAGRGVDPNSPLNMQRDPLIANPAAKPADGRNSTIDTLGREAGPSNSLNQQSDSGGNSTPPPGADLSFRAPHTDQIGAEQLQPFDESKHKGPFVDPKEVPKETLKDYDAEPPSWVDKKVAEIKQVFGGGTGDGLDNLGAAGNKKKYDTGEGDSLDVVSGDQIERVIAVQGGDTDFVPGAGTQIDESRPPKRPGDLVTDPGDEDPGAGESGGTVAPPGSEISKPVNPNDGLLGGGLPAGWGNGSGGSGGGDTGDNTGRDGFSSAATAASNTDTSGVTNIGDGSTGGIQSISEFDADIEVASDLALGLDDLFDQPFAQRSTDDVDLVAVEAVPDDGV